MITAVTTNPARVDHVVTPVYQFRLHASVHVMYILFFFSKEKKIVSLILRAHRHHYTESFLVLVHTTILAVPRDSPYHITLAVPYASPPKTHRQFSFTRSFHLPFLTTDSHARGF